MSFFDGIKKLTQPFDDDDEFYDEDEMETPIPVNTQAEGYESERKSTYFSGSNENIQQEHPFANARPRRESRNSKVVDLGAGNQKMKVVLISPENFEAAAEIADQLREKRPVLMNLEKTSKEVSRRLIDFLSGVAYALEGKIKRVATNAYIITPYNVDIMGENVTEAESSEMKF